MPQRFHWILAILLVPAFLTGCGLFSDDPDDDPLDVVIKESVPVSFTLDEEKLCPPTEDCDATPGPSPAAIDLPPVEIPVPIDILEITGNDELTEVSQRLKKVEIESIDYEVVSNTLNIPTPEFEINLGPFTATNREAQSVFLLGTLPSVPAGETPSGNIPVDEANQEQASELFKALKFTTIAYGDKDIAKDELFPPQGAVEYKLTFNLKFSANPVDALAE